MLFASVMEIHLKKYFPFFDKYMVYDARQTVGTWEILTPNCVAHQHWERMRKSAEHTLFSPQMTEQRKNKQRLGFLGSNTPHVNHHMPPH